MFGRRKKQLPENVEVSETLAAALSDASPEQDRRRARRDELGTGSREEDNRIPGMLATELQEGDRILDQGTFITTLDNNIIGREDFGLIRRNKHGLFKRKGGGLTMLTNATRGGGTFSLDSRWDFDRKLAPLNTSAQVQAFLDNRAQNWQADFAFKGPKARFHLHSQQNPMDINIAYKPGWLINMAPSVVPLYFMLGRYDLRQGGIQEFTALAYSAESEQFGIGRNVMELEYLDPIQARDPDGKKIVLDYFVCDEVPLKGKSQSRGKVTRRLHLWTDENRRLRKVVEAQVGVLMTIVRDEEINSLDKVRPYPDMLWPENMDPARD